MKKIEKIDSLKGFESFVAESRNNANARKALVEKVVKRIKEEFGETLWDFLDTMKEKGTEYAQRFILDAVKGQPEVDGLWTWDMNQDKRVQEEYDSLLRGCVSWMLVEIYLDRTEKRQDTK